MLLHNFIENKLKSYKEPERKGTIRGNPVGFSMEKYHASLLCGLVHKPLKTIASELGIVYPLIRQWNINKTFKAKLKKHCLEFSEIVLQTLRQKLIRTETKEFIQELFTPSLILNAYNIKRFKFTELSDINHYSSLLITVLTEQTPAFLEKYYPKNDDNSEKEYFKLLWVCIMACIFDSKNKKAVKIVHDYLIDDIRCDLRQVPNLATAQHSLSGSLSTQKDYLTKRIMYTLNVLKS